MGDLIALDDRRPARADRPPATRPTCFVDLADPLSYLVAERIERALPGVRLRPASLAVIEGREGEAPLCDTAWVRATAERRARELRLPLQWPERFPAGVAPAMRAAAYAVGRDRGAAYLLAAGRLAFCGGYDLSDPDVIAEAAAAAQLSVRGCLAAARDPARGQQVREISVRLRGAGVRRLPALELGTRLLWSEERISAYLIAGPPASSRCRSSS